MKRRRLRKANQGSDKKKRRKSEPRNDAFFEDDEDDVAAASSEDDGEKKHEKEEEEEAAPETAHEKKVRLAKDYIDKLKAQAAEDDDEEEGEEMREDRAGKRDTMVADLLRQEQLEESGRQQKKLVSRLVVAGEGRYVIRKHKLSVTALAITEDDRWGFSGSKDGLVLQWDVETGKSFKFESSEAVSAASGNKPSSKRVLALALDSTGRYLASGGPDRAVHLWDVRTQQHIQAFPGHRGAISSLAFRQGTTQLFSAAFDRTIKLWSADDRSYMDTLFGHQSEVLAVDCLRQERILTAGRDRTLRLWKVPEETQLVFRGYAASLESCCFVTNAEFLSGADDGSVALWSSMKKKPVYVAKNAHGPPSEAQQVDGGKAPIGGAAEAWVGSVAVCRGSDLAASGAGDGKVQLWAIENGNRSLRPLHSLPVKGFVNALAFARSGRFLLSGVGQEPRLGRWARNSEARNGVVLHKIELRD